MKFKRSKFTLRVDEDLLKKVRFIAEYNGRSINQEINVLLKKYVAGYEIKKGKININ